MDQNTHADVDKDQLDGLAMKTLNSDHIYGNTPDVQLMKKPRKDTPTLKEALLGFTQNTTLHGVRYIFMDNVALFRRFLWLALFLACSVLMSVQIIERIVYYSNHPVTVNVHVNFNKTLAFPALTLCNQNAFRATAATELNLYRLLEDLYSRKDSVDAATVAAYNASHLKMDQLYKATAHRKEDFIVACEWQDQICSPDNFTEILTDHGVCYNFNDDPDFTLAATSTGSDYGLKLTLNVEQYEYMPGPHSAAGIKILLHDQKEFPKVAELGLAVPTGTHTYVGIQLLRIQNLPLPHGTCRSERSSYYDDYSPDACQLACMTEYLDQLCGCRDMYMPNINGTPPVCTLEQYVICFRENIVDVKNYVRDQCECPIPCDFLIYDPTISFASTSVYATDRLLADTSTSSLHEKYLRARETTSRMDRLKFQHFIDLEEETRLSFQALKGIVDRGVRDSLLTQRDTLKSIHDQMEQVWSNKKYLFQWQVYQVEKNFVRAREAMEERTLMYLVLGFQEYSYQVESRIKQMVHAPGNLTLSEDVRTALYVDVLNLLNGRIDLAERAFDNYTQLYNAFKTGDPIFRYKFEDELREDNIYITPKPLLNMSLFHNSYARTYSQRLGEDILQIKQGLLQYVALANTSYFDHKVDEEEMYRCNVNFLQRGRRYYQSKSTFYAESVDYPLQILSTKLHEFDRKWRLFEESFHAMYDKVEQLLQNLSLLHDSIFSRLEEGIDAAHFYIDFGNVTKMLVAEALTSNDIYKGISQMNNFFNDIRSRGQTVYDGWSALIEATSDIWKVVLDDPDMEEYYTYKNMTEFLRSFDDMSKEIEVNFTKHREDYDFRFLLGNLDSVFLRSLEAMMADMRKFLDESDIDHEFIRKNFLQLDIFYKEKSYEQITQQQAYDIFALLCDIGGSMGLFVGASVMTICELLDLGLHHSLYSLTHRRRAS